MLVIKVKSNSGKICPEDAGGVMFGIAVYSNLGLTTFMVRDCGVI